MGKAYEEFLYNGYSVNSVLIKAGRIRDERGGEVYLVTGTIEFNLGYTSLDKGFLIVINKDGDLIFQMMWDYGESNFFSEEEINVVGSSNGGYLMTDGKIIINLDEKGDIVWKKTDNALWYHEWYNMVKDYQEGYIILGGQEKVHKDKNEYSYVLLRVNEEGKEKDYYGYKFYNNNNGRVFEPNINSLEYSVEGDGYVISGVGRDYSKVPPWEVIILMKVDSEGGVRWEYVANGIDEYQSSKLRFYIIRNPGMSYLITGVFGGGNKWFCVSKNVSSDGYFCGRDESYRHRIERRVINESILEEYNGEVRIESLDLKVFDTEFKVEDVVDNERCELCGMERR